MADAAYTVQREQYPTWCKGLNFFLDVLQRCGSPIGTLEEESIVHAAQRMTGLDDWGSQDFREPLRVLLQDSNQADYTALGKVIIRQGLITALSQRLSLEAYIKKHPEIEGIPIQKPIFILGFPRTGTTLLQNLLALGQGRRALQMWELLTPVPLSDTHEVDQKKRIRRVQRMLNLSSFLAPEIESIHAAQATSVEECNFLFVGSCAVLHYDLALGLRRFGDWLLQYDMTSPYREYRRCLQVLAQQRSTQHFVLKYPGHLWFLEALLDVFPDARIVWTHRDPVESIASCCSMFSLSYRTLYGKIDHQRLGQHLTDRLLDGVERAMVVRDRVGSKQFFDVDFQALTENPLTMVQQINESFDLPFDGETAKAMQAWLHAQQKNRRTAHIYNTQRYGLDPAVTHQRYAQYIQRFNIQCRHTA